MKKNIVSLFIIFCMVLSPISSFANQNNTEEHIIDQYLIDAGYPINFIEEIDIIEKRNLYDGKYLFESNNQTYGIFTEKYHIEYQLSENGSVIIDDDNLSKLMTLIKDSEEVKKIFLSKEVPLSCFPTLLNESKFLQMQIENINQLSKENALRSLSNWYATITCSHKSYENGFVKKHLTYSWKWKYQPVWTLTDKVAMAWSGDFAAEPDTIYWTYKKNVGYVGTNIHVDYYNDSGYGYDDYECNAGCAKNINIIGNIPGTYNRYHAGILSTDITKFVDENSRESAIGRYYHKKVFSGLTLSFSKVGPSISVSSGNNYEQSKDSAVTFSVIR